MKINLNYPQVNGAAYTLHNALATTGLGCLIICITAEDFIYQRLLTSSVIPIIGLAVWDKDHIVQSALYLHLHLTKWELGSARIKIFQVGSLVISRPEQ